MTIFRTQGHLTPKLNVAFFMGSEILNIFSSKNFFDESNIFRENGEKNFGVYDHFLEDGIVYLDV